MPNAAGSRLWRRRSNSIWWRSTRTQIIRSSRRGDARAVTGGQSYSIAGVNEFDELVDDIYDFSDKQGLEIDTLIHEEGPAQLEINLRHGDPVELADQVFMFKRTIREAALKHGVFATFMAKPMQEYAGSAMHIHQSLVDIKTGKNVFSKDNGEPSEAFFSFIGGMQHYVPKALVMMAPYVNSYRRLTPDMACPVNNAWGYDNRTTAFRVPNSEPVARRVENRLPSSDANSYLALAASLACGRAIRPTRQSTKARWTFRAGCLKHCHCLRASRRSRKCSARSSSTPMPGSNAANSRPSCR